MTQHETSQPSELLSRPVKPRKPFTAQMVLVLAVLSGAILGLAIPDLIGDTSWKGICKALLLAVAGTLVTYGVNKLAVEKGAPLAAINLPGAAVTSVVSILIVGGGLFVSSYAGLTIKSVEELRLQEHGAALSQYVTHRNGLATKAGQSGPAIQAIASDLKLKAACEFQNSCVSGRGQGGRGPVTRVLEDKSARASSIKNQFTNGEAKRVTALVSLNKLLADYQNILSMENKPLGERRIELQKINTKIGQTISALDEALPITLLRAYANELHSGTIIPSRPVVTTRMNAILRTHARSLAQVLEDITPSEITAPVFPRKTGVADTLSYLGHFAPIAAIIVVVELVFPLTLWLYTFLTLFWTRYKEEPIAPEAEEESPVGFGGLIDIYAMSDADKHLRASNAKSANTARRNAKREG